MASLATNLVILVVALCWLSYVYGYMSGLKRGCGDDWRGGA